MPCEVSSSQCLLGKTANKRSFEKKTANIRKRRHLVTTILGNFQIQSSAENLLHVFDPIAGFPSVFIDKQEHLNVNFAMFELTPRLLPTFRAWLLSTRLFCFNSRSILVKKFQLNGGF